MCCNKEGCHIIINVVTAANKNQIPTSERLRNGVLQTLRVPRSGGATLYDINGKTIAADIVIQSSYLVLVSTDGVELDRICLGHCQFDYNSQGAFRVNDWRQVDPQASYVVVNTAAAGYNAAHTIPLTFGLSCDNCGNTFKG